MVDLLVACCGSRRICQACVSELLGRSSARAYRQRRIAYGGLSLYRTRNELPGTHLVTDYKDILLPLKLHDDGFEADNDVPVRLATYHTDMSNRT